MSRTPRKQDAPKRQGPALPDAVSRTHVPPTGSSAAADTLLDMQRTAGNRATSVAVQSARSHDPIVPIGGQPLSPHVQAEMEQRFDFDFSNVRVHTGAAADTASRDQRAAAFTIGHDIVFRSGRFQPAATAGRRLLAHELAHVIQQSRSGGAASGGQEAEARSAGDSVVGGRSPSVVSAAPIGVQRSDEDEVLTSSPSGTPPSPQASLPPPNQTRIDPRAPSNPAAAADAARDFQARHGAKLEAGEGGRALNEVFSRTGNLTTPTLRRGASPELATIEALLQDDRVARVTVIPSTSAQRTPDLFVEYTDGRIPERIELTSVTSAPGPGRTTMKPTEFAEGKTSRGGLAAKTQARLPSEDTVKAAIKRKAVGSGLQVSVPVAGVPVGGRVFIDMPFGSTDPAMLHKAMSDMASQIHGDVRAITFVTRVRNESGALTRQYLTFERSGPGAFTSLAASSSPLGPRAGAGGAASAAGGAGTATAQTAGRQALGSAEQVGTRQAEKSVEQLADEAITATAARRAERAGEKNAAEVGASFLRKRAAGAAEKRAGSFAPVVGWVFVAQDIDTGIDDIVHGDVALGAATIAVAVIDAESDALHAGDAVSGVGGTALSLTVQGWATAMQISFEAHRAGKRSSELQQFIEKNGKLPSKFELKNHFKLNDEEIMMLENDVSGFGRKKMVTAGMVLDDINARLTEIDQQLASSKIDEATRANLESARHQLSDQLLPFFKQQADKEEKVRQAEIKAKKEADYRAWKKRTQEAAEKQANAATAPPPAQTLLTPPGAPKPPQQVEFLPGMSIMGNRSNPHQEVINSAGHWTTDLLRRGNALRERSRSGARPDEKTRAAYNAEVKQWRKVMTEPRRFYPSLATGEMEHKLRDLNGEFGEELDRIGNEL